MSGCWEKFLWVGGGGWHSRIESFQVLSTLDLDLDCDNFTNCFLSDPFPLPLFMSRLKMLLLWHLMFWTEKLWLVMMFLHKESLLWNHILFIRIWFVSTCFNIMVDCELFCWVMMLSIIFLLVLIPVFLFSTVRESTKTYYLILAVRFIRYITISQ